MEMMRFFTLISTSLLILMVVLASSVSVCADDLPDESELRPLLAAAFANDITISGYAINLDEPGGLRPDTIATLLNNALVTSSSQLSHWLQTAGNTHQVQQALAQLGIVFTGRGFAGTGSNRITGASLVAALSKPSCNTAMKSPAATDAGSSPPTGRANPHGLVLDPHLQPASTGHPRWNHNHPSSRWPGGHRP